MRPVSECPISIGICTCFFGFGIDICTLREKSQFFINFIIVFGIGIGIGISMPNTCVPSRQSCIAILIQNRLSRRFLSHSTAHPKLEKKEREEGSVICEKYKSDLMI
jgi:hypothetical protein